MTERIHRIFGAEHIQRYPATLTQPQPPRGQVRPAATASSAGANRPRLNAASSVGSSAQCHFF